jgi:hypothetical protein
MIEAANHRGLPGRQVIDQRAAQTIAVMVCVVIGYILAMPFMYTQAMEKSSKLAKTHPMLA